jgi:hypothetical protein
MRATLLAALSALVATRSAVVPNGPSAFSPVWTAPPPGTPSQAFPDGPVVGAAGHTIAIGGAPGRADLYATVNGFWGAGNGTSAPMPAERPPARGALGFPNCPAANCEIPVGLVIGTVSVSALELVAAKPPATWSAEQRLDTAAARVELRAGALALALETWVAATAPLGVLSIANIGAGPLTVNVSVSANGNAVGVPLEPGCVSAADGALSGAPPPCGSPGAPIEGAFLSKQASLPNSTFQNEGVLALRPLAMSGSGGGAGALPNASDVAGDA